MKTALLLSGGMDSIALAAWRRPAVAITIDYGQLPAEGEKRAAIAVTTALDIEHHIISTDVRALGSGQLAGSAALPVAGVPEWWPFRNQLLVTLAAMKGIALGVEEIILGAVKTDGAHADGRAEFIAALNNVLQVQEGALRLVAPAINLTAAELVRASGATPELLGWSHSCHLSGYACGTCRGCRKHYETWAELEFDPY
jgi:7-cyano-7-deazaguanine synthase